MTTERERERKLEALEKQLAPASDTSEIPELTDEDREWLNDRSPDLSDSGVKAEFDRKVAELEEQRPDGTATDSDTLTPEDEVWLDMAFGGEAPESLSQSREEREAERTAAASVSAEGDTDSDTVATDSDRETPDSAESRPPWKSHRTR